MEKQRLDQLLVQNGLAPSREKAKTLIMAGEVFVNGQREDKAGANFPVDAVLEVRAAKPFPYVSRGGLKLEKAVQTFPLRLQDAVCMDVGASTGGFTDVMLQQGARMVYAIDVGYGQLAWSLREDPRVVVMEKTNIRYVTPDDIAEAPSFVSIDVSFISLTKVLPPVRELLAEDAELVCLIKPQFEAGRAQVGKKGVVRDPAVHREVIQKIMRFARECGFLPQGLTFSPVKGPEGNIEYLLYLIRQKEETMEGTAAVGDIAGSSSDHTEADIAEIVEIAHNSL